MRTKNLTMIVFAAVALFTLSAGPAGAGSIQKNNDRTCTPALAATAAAGDALGQACAQALASPTAGTTSFVPVSLATAIAHGVQVSGLDGSAVPGASVNASAFTGPMIDRLSIATSVQCKYGSMWHGGGTYPMQHTVYGHFYFCAVPFAYITGYSTTVTTAQTLCSPTNTAHFPIAGGVGQSYVTIHVEATWHCPSPVGFSITTWFNGRLNANGTGQIVSQS